MPDDDRPRPRCFLALPYSPEFEDLRAAIMRAVDDADFVIASVDEQFPSPELSVRGAVLGEMARADLMIADTSDADSAVFFEIGFARAMEKSVICLRRSGSSRTGSAILSGLEWIEYESTSTGLLALARTLGSLLREYRHSPGRAPVFPRSRLATPFFVEWDRLDRSEAENLCRELLAQMGYQRLDWDKESREFDLIAELPKKDPDGFEYRELWFVTMGRNAPPEMMLEMAMSEPDYFLHRLFRGERLDRLLSRTGGDAPVTLLVILLGGESSAEQFELMRTRASRRIKGGPFPFSIRVRVWDRNYLTSLVQQFPQIGYKYFSDESRSRSKFRKTPEELYRENVALTNRLTIVIGELEGEKNRRVRAERDAVWKDISFSAAHKIGNPIFAIETNLDPLQKRVIENRAKEASEIISRIRVSVENAKGIVDQFKSLARAQKISVVSMLVRPILEDACTAARNQNVACEIECPTEVRIEGDPDRLAECFDELVSNSLRWLDKPEKKIQVFVTQPAPQPLPQSLDTSKQYTLIHFKDNGPGVPLENKIKIFDAFFSTRHHGTGLGLAVVRRIIEGHGGIILESGRPGEGADFEIYLPHSVETAGVPTQGAVRPLKVEEMPVRERKEQEQDGTNLDRG